MMITKNQIKYIQSLGQKKSRDAENKFVAEGPKIVNELLEAKNCSGLQIFALKDWMQSNPIADRKAELIEVSDHELEKISQLTTPNQVVAVADKLKWDDTPTVNESILLALDGVQDPGNMGTIIRIADWFGVKNIFCSHDCADVYNPKVVQSAMGSITRVRVGYVDLNSWLKQNNTVTIYAAVLNGRAITKMERLHKGIIVIGNESKGISEEIMKFVNVRITIPGRGNAESLNAAVATGIVLSHLCPQTPE